MLTLKRAAQNVAVQGILSVGNSMALADVDDDPLAPDQAVRTSESHKCRSCVRHRHAVHPAELGDGLVIGIKPSQ